MHRFYVFLIAALLSAISVCVSAADVDLSRDVQFSRDVRPILSDHCYACHGPDEADRQADLRLDSADGVASVVDSTDLSRSEILKRITSTDDDTLMPPPDFHKPLSDQQRQTLAAWVASGAKFAEHWSFVPPKQPSAASKIASKIAAQHGEPDTHTAIDFFINRRIESAGFEPNQIADRRALLRRVCLDLTGLPPTREQLAVFLADTSPEAYEHLVDRLLQSPSHGQHMGRYWLDLVRYADTHGLHLDNYREMWPYRDWVIDAFTNNMPFDQFVTEQLAGDLLPDATIAQQIASGFNRLNVTTNEGGSIYDEVFARNVMDRTDAFGVIFLGLTTGCAVCHDHKFDPITQQDYYSLSAFFNSLDGRAMDENIKDPSPVLRVPSPDQSQQLADYETALADLHTQMEGPIASVDTAQQSWEASLSRGVPAQTVVLKPSSVTSAAKIEMKVRDDDSVELAGPAAAKDTTTIVAALPTGQNWQTLHLQAMTETPDSRVGASENGNAVLSEITIETLASGSDQWIPVPINHALADIEQQDGKTFAVSFAIDENVNEKKGSNQGWAVAGHQQTGPRNAWFVVPSLMVDAQEPRTLIRVQLKYRSQYAAHQFKRVRLSLSDQGPRVPEDQRIKFGPIHSAGPFPIESASPGYSRVFASQGKPFKASEVFRYIDRDYRWQHRGDLPPVEINTLPVLDQASATMLHQSIKSPKKQQATLLLGTDDGHAVYLNGKRIADSRDVGELQPLQHEYTLDLNSGDNRLYIKVINHRGDSQISYAWRSPAIDVPEQLVELLRTPASDRPEAVQTALQKYYRHVACLHPDWLALVDLKKGLQASREKTEDKIPTTLVWKELKKPRQAHILVRGQYDQPGKAVKRSTPAFLPSIETTGSTDRLALARWLTSADNPLPARVAVNRFWQQVFGTGLVKTSEDFGNQGQPPSHPELLDYLAIEFRKSGWNVRALMKSLVMSDAYRRSSATTPQLQQTDPENRLLARGPRYRLDAEVLRDQAFALAGLLNDKRGGPSVKPPQPDGLWYAVGFTRSNTAKFTPDTGAEKLYRRSVYTFWKRTSPPPPMSTFDAPSRESCTARRERTNTPLQALVLMNETQYLQAAKHLAGRVTSKNSDQAADGADFATDKARIDWLFETVTIRPPSEDESRELTGLLKDLTKHYSNDLESARQLVGESESTSDMAIESRAAWVVVASTLLNLDEVVSK